MSNPLLQVADAVVAEILAAPSGTFAQPVPAVRRKAPKFSIGEGDLKDLKVSVVPGSLEGVELTRQSDLETAIVEVAFQQVAATTAAEDAVMDLAEQVRRYMRGRPLATLAAAVNVASALVVPFVAADLREAGVMTTGVRLTYQIVTDL